jgi:iron complex outermembrane recepter protein
VTHRTPAQRTASATLFAFLSLGVASQAAMSAQSGTISISPQPLAAALAEFSQQTGLKTTYPASLVEGKTAPRVNGSLSAEQALSQLLSGSGLRYQLLGTDAARIEVDPAAAQPQELPRMVVSDTDDAATSYAAVAASTGTKTDTPLIITPVVVTVIAEQALEDQHVTSLSEALTNSSGVWSYSQGMGCDGTCEAINMRGFNQWGNVMSDGIIMYNSGGITNLSNVESIEVMKGPASVLYGRMEPGGAVNLVTKKPQATQSASIDQSFGSRSLYVTNFDSTGPVTDDKSLLYRINGTWNQHDLYIKGLKNERIFVAPSMQWSPAPGTQALLEVTHDRNRYPWQRELYPRDPTTLEPVYFPWSSQITPNSQLTKTTTAKLGVTQALGEQWSVKVQYHYGHSSNRGSDDSWSIGWMDQLGSDWRIWRTPAPVQGSLDDNVAQVDLTGHFSTGGLKHTLLFGGDASHTRNFSTSGNSVDSANFNYFFDITLALDPVAPTAVLPINAWWGTHTEETRRGVYLQDQIELPHNVHVLAGLRYSKVTFDSRDEVSGVWVSDFGADAETIRATRKDDAFTPRLGVLWELRPGTSVYASYTENFGKFQGVFDWQDNALDPELSKQKEIGVKQESASGRLSASLALYDLRKTNVAVLDPAHTGCRDQITGFRDTSGTNPCYLAAGVTRARGIEVDLAGELTRGWNVLANYTYNDTRVLRDDLPSADSWVGKRIGYFPANMAKLATTYKISEGLLQGWRFGFSVRYTDQTDLGNSGPQQTITPAYTVMDVMASYGFRIAGQAAELQMNVKNFADKNYLITASQGFFTSRGRGDPRTVIARLKVDF